MGQPLVVDSDVLEEILAELRGLKRRMPVPASIGDAELVAALAESFGAQLFTAAEVIRCVEARPSRLRQAVKVTLRSHTPRGLGHFLRRVEGRSLDGLCVHRRGSESGGVIWQVSSVAGNP